jgi:hypothetical protein
MKVNETPPLGLPGLFWGELYLLSFSLSSVCIREAQNFQKSRGHQGIPRIRRVTLSSILRTQKSRGFTYKI